MNPKTGEILAMASYPTFNLNNPRDLSGVYTQEELSTMTDIEMTNAMYALWSNYCVSTIYEPGSTFKPFTVAEGLRKVLYMMAIHFTAAVSWKSAEA